MSRVLILGGGFGGVVAAETLAHQLGDEHQITLVSRSNRFVFHPALVRFAFGESAPGDFSFDLRHSMLARRINFIQAEVARIDPLEHKAILAHGDVAGAIPYDYLIFALGRRLATERVTGFFEHGHHLLNIDGALKFGAAIRDLTSGRVIIGQCPEARLPVPVYEAAFALAQTLKQNRQGYLIRITVVSPETIESEFCDSKVGALIHQALVREAIEFLPQFPVSRIRANAVSTVDKRELSCTLAMLLPPFRGSSAASHVGLTDDHGYLNVDWTMRVVGAERIYAVGDCVNFNGPKMAHMAVHQAEVAAANVAAELSGLQPVAHYDHRMMLVLDIMDGASIYFHKPLWSNDPAIIRHSKFWGWAKRVHEKYWEAVHA